jgi:hypothetical protein
MAVTPAKCSGCGQEIVFIDTPAGRKAPCDPKVVLITADDGQTYRGRVSHFSTCPKAGQFRKPKAPEEAPANPNAGKVWSSVLCGYWTDNWSKLAATTGGVPCCPECGCPGIETRLWDWNKCVAAYDLSHPGYRAFIQENKEHCFGRTGYKPELEKRGFTEARHAHEPPR